MTRNDDITERRVPGAGRTWVGHAINLQTNEITSTRPLAEPLNKEQLAPWLSGNLGVRVTTNTLLSPLRKISPQAPFVGDAAAGASLWASGDWTFAPGWRSEAHNEGLLDWNPGRGTPFLLLRWDHVVPATQLLATVSCYIGSGDVALTSDDATGIPVTVHGGNHDAELSIVFKPTSEVANVAVMGIAGLTHFSFYSATLQMI